MNIFFMVIVCCILLPTIDWQYLWLPIAAGNVDHNGWVSKEKLW